MVIRRACYIFLTNCTSVRTRKCLCGRRGGKEARSASIVSVPSLFLPLQQELTRSPSQPESALIGAFPITWNEEREELLERADLEEGRGGERARAKEDDAASKRLKGRSIAAGRW